jgi:hypothetical protein
VVGHPAIPVYLLDGPQPVIFDAGFTLLGDLYTAEIEKILERRAPVSVFLPMPITITSVPLPHSKVVIPELNAHGPSGHHDAQK